MSDPTPDPNPLSGLNELELTPDWVKSPTHDYARHPGDTGGPRGRGPRDRDRRGPPRHRSGPPPGGAGGPPPRAEGGPGRDRGRPPPGRTGKGAAPYRPGPPPVEPAPVEVVFAPEEKGFAAMVEAMKQSGRSYALFDLARLILSKPERHVVRLSRRAGADGTPPPFVFVAASESAFLDRAEALRHLFSRHRTLVCREIKTPIDPPKGNFSFVNRCGVTGAWLGPPNYHEYQARLVRHHQTHVRQLSFEQFKSRIETIKDPEAVQAWLQAMSSKTEYTCRCCEPQPAVPAAAPAEPAAAPAAAAPAEPPGGTPSEPAAAAAPVEPAAAPEPAVAPEPAGAPGANVFATLRELERHVEEQHLDQFVSELPEVTLTGTGARQSAQRGIAAAVRNAWESERRFPLKTVNLLRPRLQREGFYFFKHPGGVTYISRMRPKRFTAGQELTSQVQQIIACVRSPRGCTRRPLLVHFLPAPTAPAVPATPPAGEPSAVESGAAGAPAADAAAPRASSRVPAAVVQEVETRLAADLHWLISEGFVVEFADGRLWAMDEKKPAPPEPPKAKAPAQPPSTSAPAPRPEPPPEPAPVESAEPGASAAPGGELSAAESSAEAQTEQTPEDERPAAAG